MATLARMQYNPKYVMDLKQATGYYIGYVPETYADQAAFDGAYDLVRTDLAINHALTALVFGAIGEYVVVEGSNPTLNTLINNMLLDIADFSETRRSLLFNSCLYGLGLQRKYYTTKQIYGFGDGWTAMKSAQEVDKQRLRIERSSTPDKQQYWTMWSPLHDGYVILEDRAINPRVEDGYGLQDYIWMFNEFEESSPYFRGYINIVYKLVYVKNKIIQYWAELCEYYGGPMLSGSIDLNKAGMNYSIDGQGTAAARQAQLLKVLQDMRARRAFVMAQGDQVKVLENGSIGTNVLRELTEYIDSQIMLLILGAELSTKSGSSGSYALGEIHKDQTITTTLYYRNRLLEALQRDLVRDFLIRNSYKIYADLGIDWRSEYISIKASSTREEIKKDALEQQLEKKAVNV